MLSDNTKGESAMNEKLYSVDEAAERLHLHPEVVRRWLRSGRLPGRKLGREWRVAAADLQTLLHGREPEDDGDEEYPSCVCFPRWLEFSGLPGLVTGRHGAPAWTVLRAVIELDCQYNETPGVRFSEPVGDLCLKTGLEEKIIEKMLAKLRGDQLLEARWNGGERQWEIRLHTPIQTPISVFEVDFRFGGLKDASTDYARCSCVTRYIR